MKSPSFAIAGQLYFLFLSIVVQRTSSYFINFTAFPVQYPEAPLFVTYTTGAKERLSLTTNLLHSLRVNSPKLFANVVIACLDSVSCKWCRSNSSAAIVLRKSSCFCIGNVVATSNADKYASEVSRHRFLPYEHQYAPTQSCLSIRNGLLQLSLK